MFFNKIKLQLQRDSLMCILKLFLPFLYSLLEEGLGDDGKDMLEEKTFNFFSFLLVSGGGVVVVAFGWEGDPVCK